MHKTVNNTNSFSSARYFGLIGIGLHSTELRVSLMASCIAALAIGAFMYLLGWPHSMYADILYNLADAYSQTLLCVLTIGMSVVACTLSHKRARLSSIMLPARRDEKFLARVTVVLLGTAVPFTVLMGVIGGVTALLSLRYDPVGALGSVDIWRAMGFHIRFAGLSTYGIINSLGASLCLLSIYLLGGVLWKGPSWPITTASIIAISLIFVWAWSKAVPDYRNFIGLEYDIAYGVVAYGITTLLSWAAYRAFARMQMTNPRMTYPWFKRRSGDSRSGR